MIFNVMTLFKDFYNSFLETSIIGRVIKNNKIQINIYDIRDYLLSPYKQVDDYVYGGGNGMLLMVEPIYYCFLDIIKNKQNHPRTIYLSPCGKIFNNSIAKELSNEEEIVIFSGHYEGIDKRAIELLNAEELSIGDYVLTGGELPSMIIMYAVSLYVEGVLSDEECYKNESLYNDLLECDQYTRPSDFMGLKVPDVLLSGDHKKIKEWRDNNSIEITKMNRIDLYEKYFKSKIGGLYEQNN